MNLSKERLKGYGLSITDVVQGIRAGNMSVPAGRITQSKQEFTVRMEGEFTNFNELGDLDIFLQSDETVKLGALASIDDTSAEKRTMVRYDGKEGIALSIVKFDNAQPIKLADDVRKTIKALKAEFPTDVDVAVIRDDSIRRDGQAWGTGFN